MLFITFFFVCLINLSILKNVKTVEKDTVVDELKVKNPNLLKSLYLLSFESYLGFEDEIEKIKKLLSNY